MHLTRNQAYLHGYRGFKSLSLRQLTKRVPPQKREGALQAVFGLSGQGFNPENETLANRDF